MHLAEREKPHLVPKPFPNPPATPLDCSQPMLASAVYHDLPHHSSLLPRQTQPRQAPGCMNRLTGANPRGCYLFFCSIPVLVCPNHPVCLGGMECWTSPSCPYVLFWHYRESFCLPCNRKDCKQDCESLGKGQPLMTSLSNRTSATKPLIKGLKLDSNKLL